MADSGRLAPGTRTASPAGEVAGALAILATAGVLVALFAASLRAGSGGAAVRQPLRGSPAPPDYRSALRPAGEALVIIVIGAGRGAEIQALLAGEAELRTMLGEPRRGADLVIVADAQEAESIAAAVHQQSAITGVPPLRPVIVSDR